MDIRICVTCILLIFIDFSLQVCHINSYPKSSCKQYLFCTDVVNGVSSWQSFRHIVYDRYGNEMESEPCPHPVTYEGYELDNVYLNFKYTQKDPNNAVPIFYGYNERAVLQIVYNLDLSDDNYDYTPTIQDIMENLIELDLSKNQITEGVLSNKYDLNTLQEINLSYNTISNIVVRSYEHPYRSLKNLNISNNYLVTIPDAIFDNFVNLETLDLSHNYIEGLNQFTFEGTRNLLHLNLSYNRLTDINTSLFRFNQLKVLSLRGNRLKDIISSDFENLTGLEFLDLSSNLIKAIDDDTFRSKLSLANLDLSNNHIERMSKDIFSKLLSLSTLDLSRNNIKSLPKGLFKNNNIYSFSITDNKLEGALTKDMFSGIKVTWLDLSNQFFTTIEDFAFSNLTRLEVLLLNNNEINILSNLSFKSLQLLKELDLSNNQIVNLNFNKEDLFNLESLSLRNNRLQHIKHEHFQNLNSLGFLDLSNNAISQLEPGSFKALTNLINLRISDNPLSGTLQTSTFDGLVRLPSLDISRNLLTVVQNSSFNAMTELRDLNISHCNLEEIQYNAFINTELIETLDLSYNKIKSFFVNLTDLVEVGTILLNNNLIKEISPTYFKGLNRLTNLSLAHNVIENVDSESFTKLTSLSYLDLSYNEKLNYTDRILKKLSSLDTLILSGVKKEFNFVHINESTVSTIMISDANISNISALHLTGLSHLSTLTLSHNNVSKVEIGAFSGLRVLRHLDLSFNRIFYIQPGVFKDNDVLSTLNISHNDLSIIGYGIFRGLYYLSILDVSFNNIKDLRSERFYELKSLTHLIIDHNKIDSVNAFEFDRTSLSVLSIGDNPLPCHILVILKKRNPNFEITAIQMDEHNGENVDGVRCNKDDVSQTTPVLKINQTYDRNDNVILTDIRDILFNISIKNNTQNSNDVKYLQNMTNLIEKSKNINEKNLLVLTNMTSRVIDILNSDTNVILKKILNSLNEENVTTTTSVPLLSKNNTIDPILYVQKIKIELEKSIAEEKINIMKELENKLSSIHFERESLPTSPSNEKLVSSNEETKSLFTETCVALILLILVCLVLYKFYKSRMFIRHRLSYSTRELPGSMDNSAL